MISLLAMGIVAGQQFSIPSGVSEFVDWLSSNGYRYTAGDRSNYFGTVEHEGGRVGAFLTGTPVPGTQNISRVMGFRFQVEVAFPKEIPLDLPVFSPMASSPAGPEAYFTAHLGRTVTIEAEFDFNRTFSAKDLRNDLDQFWKQARHYVSEHGGTLAPAPPKDWSKEHFSDRTWLKRADPASVQRLIDSWGWTYRGAWGHSGNGYAFPIHVSQTNFFVHWPGNNERFDSAIYLTPFDQRDRTERIEFGKGIRVGNLRSKIEKIVAEFEKKAKTEPAATKVVIG